MSYWIIFTLVCAAFACEIAVYLRQNQLQKRRASRKLQRSINRYYV